MPGIPQGRDQGEAGPKSATLIAIENGDIDVEEVPTFEVEFASAALEATPFEDADALRSGLRRAVEDAAGTLISPAGILRLTFAGGGPLGWTVLRDCVWTTPRSSRAAKRSSPARATSAVCCFRPQPAFQT